MSMEYHDLLAQRREKLSRNADTWTPRGHFCSKAAADRAITSQARADLVRMGVSADYVAPVAQPGGQAQ